LVFALGFIALCGGFLLFSLLFRCGGLAGYGPILRRGIGRGQGGSDHLFHVADRLLGRASFLDAD
jgi:hypothetical protein